MRPSSGPRTDDAYEDEYDDLDEKDEPLYSWSAGGWTVGTGWPPLYRDEPVDDSEAAYGERYEDAAVTDVGEGSWWDEALASTLVLVGAVLFFFPEPATSMLGVLLMLAGAAVWLFDSLT